MPPTLKKLGGHIAKGLSVCMPSIHLFVCYAFETSHIFGTMYARILNFYICVAYEKLSDPYFYFSFYLILHGEVRPLSRWAFNQMKKVKYLRNHWS